MTTVLMVLSTVQKAWLGLISPHLRVRETGLLGELAWAYHGRPHSDGRILRRGIAFCLSSLVLLKEELYLIHE